MGPALAASEKSAADGSEIATPGLNQSSEYREEEDRQNGRVNLGNPIQRWVLCGDILSRFRA